MLESGPDCLTGAELEALKDHGGLVVNSNVSVAPECNVGLLRDTMPREEGTALLTRLRKAVSARLSASLTLPLTY